MKIAMGLEGPILAVAMGLPASALGLPPATCRPGS